MADAAKLNKWVHTTLAPKTYFRKIEAKNLRLISGKEGGGAPRQDDPLAPRVSQAAAAKLAAEAKDGDSKRAAKNQTGDKKSKQVDLRLKDVEQASDHLLVTSPAAQLGFCALQHGNVNLGPDCKNSKTVEYKKAVATLTLTSAAFDPKDIAANNQSKAFMDFRAKYLEIETATLRMEIEQELLLEAPLIRARLKKNKLDAIEVRKIAQFFLL